MPLYIDVRQLKVINELSREGARNVASTLGTLAGVESDVQIRSLSFLDPADVHPEMTDDGMYAASIDLTDPPYGTFLLTFSPETARALAELVAGEPVDHGFTDLHESALQEICNICTSGFIDGFANTLDVTIGMSTPTLRRPDGEDLARRELSHVSEESIAIVLDSIVTFPKRDVEVELHSYLVPAPGAFVNMLDSLDIDGFTTESTPGARS